MDQRLQHPDTVRRLLRDLHAAAEQHRFVAERIDATSGNEGSRHAKRVLYMAKIDAVERAIKSLADYQDEMEMQVVALRHEMHVDAAIADLLGPRLERRPGCDEHAA